jgi:hypothetical protein
MDLLAWGAHLGLPLTLPTPSDQNAQRLPQQYELTEEQSLIRDQAKVIIHLIANSKRQDERLLQLEAGGSCGAIPTSHEHVKPAKLTAITKPRQSSISTLRALWFEWYGQEPRLYASTATKQKKYIGRHLVAYMKLFLVNGFIIDVRSPAYRDDVLNIGVEAEKATLKFLNERNIRSRGSSAALKALQKIHRSGDLNANIAHYRQLIASGLTLDPSPPTTHDMLQEIVPSVTGAAS